MTERNADARGDRNSSAKNEDRRAPATRPPLPRYFQHANERTARTISALCTMEQRHAMGTNRMGPMGAQSAEQTPCPVCVAESESAACR